MASLTTCLRKAEGKIPQEDIDFIRQAAADYVAESGMSAREAALAAIDDNIDIAVDDRNEVAKRITEKGASVPQVSYTRPKAEATPEPKFSRKRTDQDEAAQPSGAEGTELREGPEAGRPGRPERDEAKELETVGGGKPRDGWASTTVASDKGKPLKLYTGKAREITAESFDNLTGFAPESSLGWMFTSSLADAEVTALLGEAKVQEVNLDLLKTKVFDSNELPDLASPEEAIDLRDTLMEQGYEAIMYDMRDQGGPVNFMVFSPDHVIFRAERKPSDKPAYLDQGDLVFSRKGAGETKPVLEEASMENSLELARSKQYAKNVDLKNEMQANVNAAAKEAGINLTNTDAKTEKHLTEQGVIDAEYALKDHSNAIGWYDATVTEAMEIVSTIHPEINANPNDKMAFTWAMAVTSNGLKVGKNFELAEKVYRHYKKTGRMPAKAGIGTAAQQIDSGLQTFNKLQDRWGTDALTKFMDADFTISQLKKMGFNVPAEQAETVVKGSMVLGPKIGNGFFSNLNGFFDSLTMDRWLMRTWGRWTGTLIDINPANIKNSRASLKDSIRDLRKNKSATKLFEDALGRKLTLTGLDDMAVAIQKASIKEDKRATFQSTKLGDAVRKAGNNHAKNLDGQKDAPAGGKERTWIRKVFGNVLTEMQKEHNDLTMADLQALLWYPEKKLYDVAKGEAGVSEVYTEDEAPDYANAAAQLASSKGVSQKDINAARERAKSDVTLRRSRDARDAGAGREQAADQATARGLNERERKAFLLDEVFEPEVASIRENPKANFYGKGRPLKTGEVQGTAYKPGVRLRNTLESAELPGPVMVELEKTPDAAKQFHDAIQESRDKSRFGASVYVYPTETTADETGYEDMRLFLSEDGKSGFALKLDKGDGKTDLVSVFGEEGSGAVYGMLTLAIDQGANKLDAFDTVLPGIYKRLGFVETGRDPWNEEYKDPEWDKGVFRKFNEGEPDVVYMELPEPKMSRVEAPRDQEVTEKPEAKKAEKVGTDEEINRLRNAIQGFLGKPVKASSYSVGQLPTDTASALRGIAKQFGKDIVVFKQTEESKKDLDISGVFLRGENDNTLFINEDAGNPHLAVLGHELLHSLRMENRATYQALVEAVEPYITDKAAYAEYLETLGDPRADVEPHVVEELIADTLGDNFTKKKFWEDVKTNMDGGLFQKLIGLVNNIINKAVTGLRSSGMETGSYFSDIDQVNQILAKYVADSAAARESRDATVSNEGLAFNKPQLYSDQVFYSAMGNIVTSDLPGSGTGKSYKQALESWMKKGKFKQEEYDWSGLSEWLDEKQFDKISKADVEQFLAENAIAVEDVILEDSTKPQLYSDQVVHIGDADIEQVVDSMTEVADRLTTPLLPGWEFERLPNDAGFITYRDGSVEFDAVESLGEAVFNAMDEVAPIGSRAQYGQYVIPGGENYKEILLKLPENEFTTNHWRDQEGVVAHVRMNERISDDGARVLFIEEVQSDLHQKGRKKGYVERGKDPISDFKIIDELQEAKDSGYNVPDDAKESWRYEGPGVSSRSYKSREEADAAMRDEVSPERGYRSPGIPDTPFKKSWPMLAMKRMIRYAAENGFDQIAWTTGEQQAARYDLSKEVSYIEYEETSTNKYYIRVIGKNTGVIASEQNQTPEDLEGMIGKGLTEQIINKDGEYDKEAGNRTIYADDFKLGGEGMKGFYDQILPAAVNKYVKKWDSKTKTISVGDEKQTGIDVTQEMKDAALAGQPMFSLANRSAGGNQVVIPEENLWRAMVRRLQDRFDRLRVIQDQVEISDDVNTYYAEEEFHGKVEDQFKKFEAKEVKPLIDKITASGFSMEQVDEYLYAKHAPEANAHIQKIDKTRGPDGSGMSDKESADIIASYSTEEKRTLDSIARDIYAINNERLEMMEQAGLISEEDYLVMSDYYDFYVPLKGRNNKTINEAVQGAYNLVAGFRTPRKSGERRKGRRSRAQSPIVHTIAQYEEAIINREKNEVNKVFLNLVQENMDVVDDQGNRMWEIITDFNVPKKPVWNADESEIRYVKDSAWSRADDVLNIKVDGENVLVKINDKLLARAMNNMGIDRLDKFTQIMGGLNRYLAAINTSYNPEFVLSNAARDIQTALINLQGEQEIDLDVNALSMDVMKSLPAAMKGVYKGSRDPKAKGEWVQHFRDYSKSGAKVGFFGLKDFNQKHAQVKALLHKESGTTSGNIRKAISVVGQLVEDSNSAVENAARLAVFVQAQEHGLSNRQAAHIAKNLTVNFNRKGEMGTFINAYHLFYNASIQGTARLWGAAKNKRVQKILGSIVVASFALAELNRLMAGEDDDGENYYDKIPSFVKERNLIIMTPWAADGSYITIPLPYGYNVPYVVGETISSSIHGKSVMRGAVNITDALIGSFNPIGSSDSEDYSVKAIKMISPTWTDPLVELATNESFYGSPIMPESMPWNEHLPDSHRYWNSTSAMTKGTAQAINTLTGGDKYTPGAIDVSPDAIEHLYEFFTGSAGRFVKNAMYEAPKQAYGVATGEAEVDPNKIPFARRLFKKPTERELTRSFYDNSGEVEAALQRVSAMERGKDLKARMQFVKDNRPLLNMEKLYKKSKKDLSDINKKKAQIRNSDASKEEKERRIKLLDERSLWIKKKFNKRYGEVVKP